jgi:hypothetical protein
MIKKPYTFSTVHEALEIHKEKYRIRDFSVDYRISGNPRFKITTNNNETYTFVTDEAYAFVVGLLSQVNLTP